jgi:cytochrome b
MKSVNSLGNSGSSSSLVWDLPTRIFHWLLVLTFSGAFLTFDDNRYLYAHVYCGYALFALLLFRFVWGMVGTHYARFRTFAHDWPSVHAYLKGLLTGSAARHIGHNPIGGWAIFLMLALGLLVSITGLLVLGGEEAHGPLRHVVSYEVGTAAREFHEFFAWSMLSLVGVHIAGVLVESMLHKENLVWAMLSGYKDAVAGHPGVSSRGLVGVAMLVLALGSAGFYFRGYLIESAEKPYVPFIGHALPDNPLWRKECGDCHLAFHPTLLPARSWQKMMAEQDKHFGESLGLDDATLKVITRFLVDNAAEAGLSEPARKINASVPVGDTPQHIVETRYWKRKHDEIDAAYWKDPKIKSKINCGACHLDAEQGTFEDSGMRLPALTRKTP